MFTLLLHSLRPVRLTRYLRKRSGELLPRGQGSAPAPLFAEEPLPLPSAAALASSLPASTLERISVIAGGDAAQEAAIITATEQRLAREARDARLSEGWRRAALDAALESELTRIAAIEGAAATPALGAGEAGSSSSPSSSVTPALSSSTTAAAAAAASLLLKAAHAVLTSAGSPVGPGSEPQLLQACTSLGIDVSALQRLAAARQSKAEAEAAAALGSHSEGSASGSEDFLSGEDSDLEAASQRLAPFEDPLLEEEEDIFHGIALPPLPATPGTRLRLAGAPLHSIPADAPGDLNPTSTEEAAAPPSYRRAAYAEVRARNELFLTRRLLLQAIAAHALESQQLQLQQAQQAAQQAQLAAAEAEAGEEQEIYVLPSAGSTPPPPATAPLLSATHLLLSLRGSPLLGRGALSVGWLAPLRPPSPSQPSATPHTVAQKRGGALSKVGWSGPAGIHALSGLSEGLAGPGLPAPVAISAEEANELAVELGYPPRDPATNLAIVTPPEAALQALLARKALRRRSFDVVSREAAHAAFDAAAAPTEGAMAQRLLEAVDAEEAALGVAPAATRASLLPPGFRNWTEVATTAVAPPRKAGVARARSAAELAVLNSPLRAAKDGHAPPAPRAQRVAHNVRDTLTQLLTEGAVGPLALAHPALFPAGMPPEVAHVSVTPDLRAAYVRWTLPALARVQARAAAQAVAPRPAAPPPATLQAALQAGMHLTSPAALALLQGGQAAGQARAAARARAGKKPTAAAAYEAAGARGGGVSPYLAAPGGEALRAAVAGCRGGLEAAAFDLRRALAHRLGLRFVPRLHFFLWEGQRAEEVRGEGAAAAAAAAAQQQRPGKGSKGRQAALHKGAQ